MPRMVIFTLFCLFYGEQLAMVVAQLTEWSLPIERSAVQNQSCAKIYDEHILLLTVGTKIKKKEVGNGPFLTLVIVQ